MEAPKQGVTMQGNLRLIQGHGSSILSPLHVSLEAYISGVADRSLEHKYVRVQGMVVNSPEAVESSNRLAVDDVTQVERAGD